jgi:hypothetical protein
MGQVIYVRRRPDIMGLLDKPPASPVFLPSRASSRTRSPALLAPQCQYEAIRVWSYTTFIVNEAVVNRKLAVETVRLGRIRSCWLLSGPAEDLLLLSDDGVALCSCSCQVRHSLPLPCFYGRTLSRTVPACCTGPPCWKCPKLWRQQKYWRLPKIHWFLPNYSSLYLCSQASYQKMVKTQMLTITVQYQFLYSRPPN